MKPAILVLAALAMLTACQKPVSEVEQPQSEKEQLQIGRYQMMQQMSGKVTVVVLDTAKGTLQNCLLVNERYHCLAQTDRTSIPGGLPEAATQ